MAFCSVCGKELSDGARFCTFCGTPTPDANKNPQFEGVIKKCPNCGEIINSFTVKCPTCGFEIRGIQATSSVKELAAKLQQLDSTRPRGRWHLYPSQNISSTDEQIANLISSFAIPNTKEDLFEFFIMASSNINLETYGINRDAVSGGQKAISRAWEAKYEQAYNKACISFANEPEFARIDEIYKKKQGQISSSKKKYIAFCVGLIVFIVIAYAFVFFATR